MNDYDLIEEYQCAPKEHSPKAAVVTLHDAACEANLLRAWDRVRRNGGAAGVDRLTITELEPHFPGFARQLSRVLLDGKYHPQPVRRILIPKVSGVRKLGIPTVIDRVVQQALVQVLQPLFEPRFSNRSFAYRPGRSPLDAVHYVQQRLAVESGWVLHLDVEDFFDSVAHGVVLSGVSGIVADAALVGVVRDTLSSGVCERGKLSPTFQGLAQGSPLSPLLANVVLDGLDQWLDIRGAVFARYADDVVVLVDTAGEGERLKDEVGKFLSELSLKLNQNKTMITPARECEFLGFSFRTSPGGRCLRSISRSSILEFQRALADRLLAGAMEDFQERIRAVRTLLNSWMGYYGASEDPRQLEEVVAQAEDALRFSEWQLWRSPAAKKRNLMDREVEPGLAHQASFSPNDLNVLQALRQAFPSQFFQSRGFGLAGRATLAGTCVDYSGRIPTAVRRNVGTTNWGYRHWCLIRLRWLTITVALSREKHWLLPRLLSVQFEFLNRHRIIIAW